MTGVVVYFTGMVFESIKARFKTNRDKMDVAV